MLTEPSLFARQANGVSVLEQQQAAPASDAATPAGAEAMIAEGAPPSAAPLEPVASAVVVTPALITCATCGGPTVGRAKRCAACAKLERATRARETWLGPEVPAEQRAAERRAALRQFRLYCFSCGRSTTVLNPPRQTGRCESCGGSMLTELESD